MDEKVTTPSTTHAGEGNSADGHDNGGFPAEAFACPYCGQMLAPNVRVCVACRQPINASDIVSLPAAPSTPAGSLPQEVRPRVQFSLVFFLIVLALSLGIAALALETLGPVKSQYVMPGIVLLSSIWVYFDASQRKLPKPLQWSIGSLLVWIVVFPWYLARRRQPAAVVPFIEMEGSRFVRVILVLLLAGLLFSVLLQYLHPLK